jgi:methanogenic corrinoid protein MtbC1
MHETIEAVAEAVVGLKPGEVPAMVVAALDAGVPARTILTDGLAGGMLRVGEKYAAKEYFIPEVLVASKGMYAGLDVVRPHLNGDAGPASGTVVLGVVKGDRHDIGKNVVKVLLEATGFDVIDLGRNVDREKFLDALRESGATLLGLSTLMTTTMPEMAAVVDSVRKAQDLQDVTVLIGGAPRRRTLPVRSGPTGTEKTPIRPCNSSSVTFNLWKSSRSSPRITPAASPGFPFTGPSATGRSSPRSSSRRETGTATTWSSSGATCVWRRKPWVPGSLMRGAPSPTS